MKYTKILFFLFIFISPGIVKASEICVKDKSGKANCTEFGERSNNNVISEGKATNTSSSQEDAFLRKFYGFCISNASDMSKVEIAVKILNLKEAPKDIKNYGSPTVKGNYNSWIDHSDGINNFISLNLDLDFDETNKADACALLAFDLDNDILTKNIITNINAIIMDKKEDAYVKQIFFTSASLTDNCFIIFSSSEAYNKDPSFSNLGLICKKRKAK